MDPFFFPIRPPSLEEEASSGPDRPEPAGLCDWFMRGIRYNMEVPMKSAGFLPPAVPGRPEPVDTRRDGARDPEKERRDPQ